MPSRHHVPLLWKAQDTALRALHHLQKQIQKNAKHAASQKRAAARHAASVAKHPAKGGSSRGSGGASHRGQFQDSRGKYIGDRSRYHSATNKKGHRYGGTRDNPQYYTDLGASYGTGPGLPAVGSTFDPGYYTTPYGDVTIGNGWNPYAATHVDGTGHVLPGPGTPPPSVWGGLGPSPYGGTSLSARGQNGSNGGRVRKSTRRHAAKTASSHHATPHHVAHPHNHAAKHPHQPAHTGAASHRNHANHPALLHPGHSSTPHHKRSQR